MSAGDGLLNHPATQQREDDSTREDSGARPRDTRQRSQRHRADDDDHRCRDNPGWIVHAGRTQHDHRQSQVSNREEDQKTNGGQSRLQHGRQSYSVCFTI
jgi:hypothetical protein